MSAWRRLLPAAIAGVAAVMLAVGLTAPLITFHPERSDLHEVLEAVDPGLLRQTETFNALQTISSLWRNHERLLAMIFISGSVVIPYIRFALYFYASWSAGRARTRIIAVAEHVSRYCLLDVMALALFVGSLSQMPGAYEARLEWGFYPIVGSIFLGMVPPFLFPRAARQASADQ